MIKLDDDLLAELGLQALSPDDKKRMLTHIYETLEMRVGMELAKQMSDAQLNEFEEYINRNDEAGALRWLETNFPNYKDVVAAEFDKLKAEIKQIAPQILHDASMAAQQQQPQAAIPPTPPQSQQPQPYQPQEPMQQPLPQSPMPELQPQQPVQPPVPGPAAQPPYYQPGQPLGPPPPPPVNPPGPPPGY